MTDPELMARAVQLYGDTATLREIARRWLGGSGPTQSEPEDFDE